MADLSKLPTLIAAEDWAGAEKLLRRAARAQKPAPEVFYNLGKVLMERGQAKQAVSWFRKAVLARPSYAAAWFELGRAALGADDLQGACDGFARAVALAPGDADARLNLARLVLRLGDWEKAEALWRSIDADEAKPALFRAA
ncbi:MAG: tetratricopeptide repeat protein, partial [Pseudomonadota bacterium]